MSQVSSTPERRSKRNLAEAQASDDAPTPPLRRSKRQRTSKKSAASSSNPRPAKKAASKKKKTPVKRGTKKKMTVKKKRAPAKKRGSAKKKEASPEVNDDSEDRLNALQNELNQLQAKAFVIPEVISLDNDGSSSTESDENDNNDGEEDQSKCEEIDQSLNEHKERVESWQDELNSLVSSHKMDSDENELNGESLYAESDEISREMNNHFNNAEQVKDHRESLSQYRDFLNEKSESYTNAHASIASKVAGLDDGLNELNTRRIAQEEAFKAAHAALVATIKEQNESIQSGASLRKQLAGLVHLKSIFNDVSEKFQTVESAYNAYSSNASTQLPDLKGHLKSKWDSFESKWTEWTQSDLYFWACHACMFFKFQFGLKDGPSGGGKLTKSALKKFLKKMGELGMTGESLESVGMKQLMDLGIDNHDYRSDFMAKLQGLLAKYPRPDKVAADDIPADPMVVDNDNGDAEPDADPSARIGTATADPPIDDNASTPLLPIPDQPAPAPAITADPVSTSDQTGVSPSSSSSGSSSNNDSSIMYMGSNHHAHPPSYETYHHYPHSHTGLSSDPSAGAAFDQDGDAHMDPSY